jgi:ribosomal silencing factor RsfS
MWATFLKMLTKNVEKNVRNISKNVDEKILTTGHKIINKKLKKSQSAWILRDMNVLSGLF